MGVVFRRTIARENLPVTGSALSRIYRRMELRGEIRGGRFVGGFSGEQFALPEAVSALRAARRDGAAGELVSISASDPLNLVGIVTPGQAVPAIRRNRILFRDGAPIAVSEAGRRGETFLVEVTPREALELRAALLQRRVPPMVRRYLGKSGRGVGAA